MKATGVNRETTKAVYSPEERTYGQRQLDAFFAGQPKRVSEPVAEWVQPVRPVYVNGYQAKAK